MTTWSPRRINLQKLAGLKSIIGLDISERRVRIAELRILGGDIDKLRSRFTVANHFTFDIDHGSSVESSAGAIVEEMKRHGMRSRYAVAALEMGRVKTVRAEVPPDVTDIDEWLADNFDKLVRIPVPLQELAYRYETVRAGPTPNTLKITFARTSEIESIVQLVKSLDLDLIALSTGARDSINPLFFSDWYSREGQLCYVFDGGDGAEIFDIEDGKVVGSYSSPSAAELSPRQTGDVLFAGTAAGNGGSQFSPFGVPGEYALAAGLAVRGFLPELHPIDFLPSEEKEVVLNRLSKGLFQRLVLVCGGILLAMLLLQSIFTMYVNHAEDEIDARLLESGAGWSELIVLEKQNARMRNELAMIESDSARTKVAKVLHDIAKITPDGVWLHKITLTKGRSKDPFRGKSGYVFLISGYSGDSRRIAEFVRLFGTEPDLQDVRIVRSGLPAYGENMTAVGKKVTAPLTFTLSLVPKL